MGASIEEGSARKIGDSEGPYRFRQDKEGRKLGSIYDSSLITGAVCLAWLRELGLTGKLRFSSLGKKGKEKLFFALVVSRKP